MWYTLIYVDKLKCICMNTLDSDIFEHMYQLKSYKQNFYKEHWNKSQEDHWYVLRTLHGNTGTYTY